MPSGKVYSMTTEPKSEHEKIANACIESLKERLGDDDYGFIVHVVVRDGDEVFYCTGAALEDPRELPLHIYRAFVAITDEKTREFLRDLMLDA